jgi:hypothetical protein
VDSDARASLCPDTTSRSALHRLAGYGRSVDAHPKLVRIYFAAAAIAYVPVLVATALARVPLWRTDTLSVPFLRDWGLAFGLLVSFPTLLVLFVDDQRSLDDALTQVECDGVLERVSPSPEFGAIWERRFGTANRWSQIVGIVGGIALASLTLRMYLTARTPSWIVPHGGLGAVSVAYAYGITLLYGMVIVYIWRSIMISSFLRALVKTTKLRLLPFHPDKCGGLRPVGQLGLRNQYVLTTLGINIVLLLVVWVFQQGHEATLRPLMILASVAYLVCGPLVFMGPLLPFRDGMLRAKREWSSEVARLLRAEFARLRETIRDGTIADSDDKLLERLRKFGAIIDELPVWPFDARTLRTFATAFVLPLASPVLVKLVLAGLGL